MRVTNRSLNKSLLHYSLVWIVVLSAVCSVSSHQANLGGYAGVLDRMGAGAAELGTGNAGTVREGAIPAAYWNPALLAFQRHTMAAAGADIRSLNRNGGMLGIQGIIAPNMGVGVGIVNRGDFHVEVYDKNEKFQGIARPQDFGFYLGVGLKTSRKNSYGASIHWYYSNKDVGGQGDVNTIGIFNFGWYRSWNSRFKTGLVLRNLGLNSSLSARYDLRTGVAESGFDMDRSGEDFIPKTIVAAMMYQFTIIERPLDVYFEFLDFVLYDKIFDEKIYDRDHHAVDIRVGADWHLSEVASIRTGYDRSNICLGVGYTWKTDKGKKLTFDYALMLERVGITFNPFSVGIKYEL
jgi:hypothetical protein